MCMIWMSYWYDLLFVNIFNNDVLIQFTYLIIKPSCLYVNTTDEVELLTHAEKKNSRKNSAMQLYRHLPKWEPMC